jgi:hypothetical protein
MRIAASYVTILAFCLVAEAEAQIAGSRGPSIIVDSGTPTPAIRSNPQPTNFLAVESGLGDCNIPFDELRTRSPFCQGPGAEGRRCERYSPSQFPEVVAITIHRLDGRFLCTGTVLAPNWVITAAHCFLQDGSTAAETGTDTDLTLIPPSPSSVTVKAVNALTLAEADRTIPAIRVIVFRKYGGRASQPPYRDDLTLIELAQPFPATAVQPALLASADAFAAAATLAGYGLSNADGGSNERFNLTWPAPLIRALGQFSFTPAAGGSNRSAFCQGDSGGPVFAGRYRGCKRTDLPPEPRPRLLQGVISFDKPGNSSDAGNEFLQGSLKCMNASNMVMTDITLDERRDWICATTSNQAGGCQ